MSKLCQTYEIMLSYAKVTIFSKVVPNLSPYAELCQSYLIMPKLSRFAKTYAIIHSYVKIPRIY
jgi:hypothetical protein